MGINKLLKRPAKQEPNCFHCDFYDFGLSVLSDSVGLCFQSYLTNRQKARANQGQTDHFCEGLELKIKNQSFVLLLPLLHAETDCGDLCRTVSLCHSVHALLHLSPIAPRPFNNGPFHLTV